MPIKQARLTPDRIECYLWSKQIKQRTRISNNLRNPSRVQEWEFANANSSTLAHTQRVCLPREYASYSNVKPLSLANAKFG